MAARVARTRGTKPAICDRSRSRGRPPLRATGHGQSIASSVSALTTGTASGPVQSVSTAIVQSYSTGLMLANAAYASSTVVRYDRAVAQFINYAQLGKFSVQSVHELDCALASYCAFLYDQGYAPRPVIQSSPACSVTTITLEVSYLKRPCVFGVGCIGCR